MTTESELPGGEPHQPPDGSRRHRRALWFPLVLLAVLILVSIPINDLGGWGWTVRTLDPGGNIISESDHTVMPIGGFVYWPIALVLAYALIVTWYRRSGTRVWPYVVVGVVIAAVTAGVSWWARGSGAEYAPLFRVVQPSTAIGLGLLVLAGAERSLALLVTAVVYLVIVLVPLNVGWNVSWTSTPYLVVQGGALLLAGIGFAVVPRIRAR